MHPKNDRPDAEFDYNVKRVVETNFPLEVTVDENHSTGYFKITSAFPQYAGVIFRYQNASYDEVANHISFSYEILVNDKNADIGAKPFKDLLFNVLQVIYQVECNYLLHKGRNDNNQ